jgi:peptidoglycan/LPS O-acetylase OafA/YrhL
MVHFRLAIVFTWSRVDVFLVLSGCLIAGIIYGAARGNSILHPCSLNQFLIHDPGCNRSRDHV